MHTKRGYCLTPTGLKKVESARWSSSQKLSWEKISLLGCLDRTTVSKAVNGNSVDLRTLKKLFSAVCLPLSDEDYCNPSGLSTSITMNDKELLTKAAEDLEKAAEESSGKRKQELLNRAKELRTRAAILAD